MLNLSLQELQQHATPFYVYDLNLLRQTLQQAKQEADRYNFNVHYALKANTNGPVLDEMRHVGFGADCVSGNEVRRAIENGFEPAHVVLPELASQTLRSITPWIRTSSVSTASRATNSSF